MNHLMELTDKTEADIISFLDKNPEGGKFVLPVVDIELEKIFYPALILIFEERGWITFYGYDEIESWLDFTPIDETEDEM